MLRALFSISTVAAAIGCASCNPASAIANAPAYAPKDQSKCSIHASQARPLIVEWPSADRLELESRARQGIVAVRSTGCDIEPLYHCSLPAKYAYVGGTPKEDELDIDNQEDLYANLPVGAAKLEGRLDHSGKLVVKMSMIGRYESPRASVRADELQGDCDGATHFISGVTLGAFEFYAEGKAEVRGGASIGGMGASTGAQADHTSISHDGRPEACAKASSSDPSPPEGCGALIRIEIVPLGAAKTLTPTCPSGTQWDGSECVAKKMVTQAECPAGTRWDGASCLATIGAISPAPPPIPTAAPVAPMASSGAPGAPGVMLGAGAASPDPPAPLPAVKFTSPASNQVIPAAKAGDTLVKLEVKNWQTALGSGHVHLILDGRPYKPIYDPSSPVRLSDLTGGDALAPGQHVLIAFPARPNHESVKTPGAVAILQFWVDGRGPGALDLTRPLLIYSRPKGEYKGEMANHVLVDFQLVNERLARGGDHVHIAVTGPGAAGITADVTQFGQPFYLDNLQDGSYTVRLDLLGADGSLVPGNWSSVTRTINISHQP